MLNKVQDSSGRELRGILKDNYGALVVKDDDAFRKYHLERKRILDIVALQEEVIELRKIVEYLMSKDTKTE